MTEANCVSCTQQPHGFAHHYTHRFFTLALEQYATGLLCPARRVSIFRSLSDLSFRVYSERTSDFK